MRLWIALLFALGSLTWSQGEAASGSDESSPAKEAVRARWQSRPAAERARLERNLEEFERLPPEARRELLTRARGLRQRALEGHPGRESGARRSFEKPEEGRERMRERCREEGRRLRTRMPDDLRRQLEEARPELRRRIFERLLDERGPSGHHALERIGRRLELSPDEMLRLERLPPEERLEALRDLGRARRGRLMRAR